MQLSQSIRQEFISPKYIFYSSLHAEIALTIEWLCVDRDRFGYDSHNWHNRSSI